jgi:hypothetical protein
VVQDLQAISAALQSGDISAARQGFNALTQLFKTNGSDPPQPLLDALGKALQSGDLATATGAISALGQRAVGVVQAYTQKEAAYQQRAEGGAMLNSLIDRLDTLSGMFDGSAASTNGSGSSASASSASAANPPTTNAVLNVIA